VLERDAVARNAPVFRIGVIPYQPIEIHTQNPAKGFISFWERGQSYNVLWEAGLFGLQPLTFYLQPYDFRIPTVLPLPLVPCTLRLEPVRRGSPQACALPYDTHSSAPLVPLENQAYPIDFSIY